nr:ABC transporter substrate-binding protein [Mesotoga sp.]
MKKVMLVVFLVVVSLAFSSLLEDIRSRGVLRVGQDAGYMPLYGTDPDGKRIGLEVEILKEMA